MSLLDDLAKAGKNLPPSHVPSVSDIQNVVGAIVHHLEHGDSFLKASDTPQNTADFFGAGGALEHGSSHGSQEPPEEKPVAEGELSPAEVQELQQMILARREQPTVTTVEPEQREAE